MAEDGAASAEAGGGGGGDASRKPRSTSAAVKQQVSFTVEFEVRVARRSEGQEEGEAEDGGAATASDGALSRPSLRYTFLDGQQYETEPLDPRPVEGGATDGGEWTVVVPEKVEEPAPPTPVGGSEVGDGEGGEGGDAAAAATEAEAEGSEEGEPVAHSATTTTWRWTKTHGPVMVDEDFATHLHHNPHLAFFLACDQPPKSGDDAVDEDAPPAKEARRGSAMGGEVDPNADRTLYCGMLELDMSAMLDDDETVGEVLASAEGRTRLVEHRAALAVQKVVVLSPAPHVSEDAARVALMEGGDALDAAAALQWLTRDQGNTEYAALRASELQSAGKLETKWQRALFDGLVNAVHPPAPPGLELLGVTVHADKPLLTPVLRHKLNPLALTLGRVKELPGLFIETSNPAMQKHMLPTKFAMLDRHCEPIYACFKFPTGGADGACRVVRTMGLPQLHPDPAVGRPRCWQPSEGDDEKPRFRERSIAWNMKTVFLASVYDRDELSQLMESSKVVVEIHDRDVKADVAWPGDDWGCRSRYYEDLVKGSLADGDAELAGGDVAAEDGGGDDNSADGGGKPPMALAEVDSMVVQESHELLHPTAGDRFAHGVAHFGLGDLLSNAKELAEAFRVTALSDTLAWGTKAEKRELSGTGKGGRRKPQRKSGTKAPGTGGGKGAAMGAAEFGRTTKLTSSVVPTKRRVEADEDEDQKSWDYNEEERLVRYLGGYNTCGTELTVTASLVRPLYSVAENTQASVPETVHHMMPTSKFTESLGASGILTLNTLLKSTSMGTTGGSEAVEHDSVPYVNWRDKTFTESGMRVVDATKLPVSDAKRGRRPRHSTLFERATFFFPYGDLESLRSIQGVITTVNERALPGVSVRSYQLTEEERRGAEDGSLDIITGFAVMDTDMRLIVAEGLGAGAMRELHNHVLRSQANDKSIRMLADPSVRFTNRLYACFDVDLKRIKLRNPLAQVVESPEIYNRAKVSVDCFEALQRLHLMTTGDRLRLLRQAEGGGFPEVDQLLRLESMYGEAISVEDMDGKPLDLTGTGHGVRFDMGGNDGASQAERSRNGQPSPRDGRAHSVAPSGVTMATSVSTRFQDNAARAKTMSASGKMKADTDQRNPVFTQLLRQREADEAAGILKVDFLAETRDTIQQVKTKRAEAKAIEDATPLEMYDGTGGEIYIYSGQKRQYLEWQKEAMRRRLASAKNATFTYSKDYQSLSMCMVNEEEVELNAKQAAAARFTTPSGFVYPAKKEPAEYSRHPLQLSEARKEDLRSPWVENENHPAPVSRDATEDPAGRPDFDSVPSTIPPKGYAADGSEDPNFFKSVHLTGDGLEAEMKQARLDAAKAWNDKVVTDSLHFQPHYGDGYTRAGASASALGGDKPSQLDKTKDVLDGRARKKGVKAVRRSQLPSGKLVKLKTAPAVTIFAEEGGMLYSNQQNPVDFTSTMRPNDVSRFIGTDPATGDTVRFVTQIHGDLMKPKSQTIRCQRSIPDLRPDEGPGSGGVWGGGDSLDAAQAAQEAKYGK